MVEPTLLEQALNNKKVLKCERVNTSEQETDLILAFLKRDITAMQAARVLKIDRARLMFHVVGYLRSALDKEEIKIEKCPH